MDIMDIFDGKNSKKIEYLDDERKKIWNRLVMLEKKVEEKPSDLEKEIQQASKKAAEFRNKTEERFIQANEIYNNIQITTEKINEIYSEITNLRDQITKISQNSKNESDGILERSQELSIFLEELETTLEAHPKLKDELSELDSTIKSIEENASKANFTYKGIISKKVEIDELHREIIGYEEKGDNDEVVLIEGLKSELEASYDTLISKSDELNKRIDDLKLKSVSQYDEFISYHKSELETIKSDTKSEYDTINKRIASLLPNAMTAGLSSAFISKKKEEEALYDEYKEKFNKGIFYLTLVSLLPIAISIYFLSKGEPLTEVIMRSPKVILSLMPLYIPLIWNTISANKKVNLSKRLIEEYSHKQVLSMTIEGLSNQINSIEDSSISEELRTQLIRSFLMVTSENPGKLISNYQKSDNPILNLFDRDKKDTVEDNGSIIKTIEDKTKKIFEKVTDEIEDNIVNKAKNTLS
jgi:uncharacterized coiled-coil DUF342 family protein